MDIRIMRACKRRYRWGVGVERGEGGSVEVGFW